ncbi:MAG: hypothetical protein AAGI69_09740 [Cyanobacteria bacterium P01_H01_bin.21]
MIRGVEQILALTEDDTKIIPGHGSRFNRARRLPTNAGGCRVRSQ